MIDTLGLLLVVVLRLATWHDNQATFRVLEKLNEQFYTLVKIFADEGFQGKLIKRVKQKFRFILEIVMRTATQKNFKVFLKRWIVERTFSWFENYRRLNKDFEYQTNTA